MSLVGKIAKFGGVGKKGYDRVLIKKRSSVESFFQTHSSKRSKEIWLDLPEISVQRWLMTNF
jgi:hypothetical protein